MPARGTPRNPLIRILLLTFMALLISRRSDAAPAQFIRALNQGQKQTIVLYGTSLTANAYWPKAFSRTLCKSYGCRIKVINAAKGGMDSRWGLANIRERVIHKLPDTVFIEFSINDALQASRLSVNESLWNLKTMVAMIRAERPGCEVILMIMNPPTGEPLSQRPRIQDYTSGYRRMAKRMHCQLIDFSPAWQRIISREPARWNRYAPDGLHPNKLAGIDITLPILLRGIGFEK